MESERRNAEWAIAGALQSLGFSMRSAPQKLPLRAEMPILGLEHLAHGQRATARELDA